MTSTVGMLCFECMACLIPGKGKSPFKPRSSSTALSSHSLLQSVTINVRKDYCSGGLRGGTFRSLLRTQIKFHDKRRHQSWFSFSGDGKDLFRQLGSRSVMSVSAFAAHSSTVGKDGGSAIEQSKEPRKFCHRCWKAAPLCICKYFNFLVKNKTAITILQHPEERKHHIGSARIACLGLQTAELITVPEIDELKFHRMRPKVPGSKRSLSGRGGKKAAAAQLLEKDMKSKASSDPKLHQPTETVAQCSLPSAKGDSFFEEEAAVSSSEGHHSKKWTTIPPWIKLRPDAGLLFPSVQALDLWPSGMQVTSSSESVLTLQSELGMASADGGERGNPSGPPSQLIVLDGTWSKARRIYCENPWLNSLPHYRLPTLQPSRYGSLRPEPKPGFLSTVESIVLALQLLEPETKDLDSLLNVFDSMIDDQKRCMTDHNKLERGKHVSRANSHREK